MRCHSWLLLFTSSFRLLSIACIHEQAYRQARQIRIHQGHEAALPYYQELISGDTTAATHIAANHNALKYQDCACQGTPEQIRQLREHMLRANFTLPHIRHLFQIHSQHPQWHAICPVYLLPRSAGTLSEALVPSTAMELWVSLFLLGICATKDALYDAQMPVNLLQQLGLLFPSEQDPDLMVPYVQIFPLQLQKPNSNLFFVTDWHPRVLSTTQVGTKGSNNAVMYIGPDSLALVQHWWQSPCVHETAWGDVLDVCTGSGIQLLASTQKKGIALDINERALQFTWFNSVLNGVEDRIKLVLGDLQTQQGRWWTPSQDTCPETMPLLDLLKDEQISVLTANPPFLPVPPSLEKNQHGRFSSGGASGEAILASCIQLSSQLRPTYTAIVSEFFFPGIMDRLAFWYGNIPDRLVLLTNEDEISTKTYATRRSDSLQDRDIWERHLYEIGITSISPGILVIRTDNVEQVFRNGLREKHIRVPRSTWGSIWTPSNPDGVSFVHDALERWLIKCDKTNELWNDNRSLLSEQSSEERRF